MEIVVEVLSQLETLTITKEALEVCDKQTGVIIIG